MSSNILTTRLETTKTRSFLEKNFHAVLQEKKTLSRFPHHSQPNLGKLHSSKTRNASNSFFFVRDFKWLQKKFKNSLQKNLRVQSGVSSGCRQKNHVTATSPVCVETCDLSGWVSSLACLRHFGLRQPTPSLGVLSKISNKLVKPQQLRLLLEFWSHVNT